jgi:hypothetical protein
MANKMPGRAAPTASSIPGGDLSRPANPEAKLSAPGDHFPTLPDRKDNMGWSGWEKFRNLTPNDKTNLQEQE